MKKPKRKKPKYKVGNVVRFRDNEASYRRINGVESVLMERHEKWLYHFAGDSWSLLESQLRPLTHRERSQ